MRKPSTTHEIPCDAVTFWSMFWDDDEFTKRLYLEGLGFEKCEILERTETERRIRLVPNVSLPKSVMRILGDGFAYEDHATLDRDDNRLRWEMKPNTLADRLHMQGSVAVEPLGDGKSRLHYEVTMEAKIPGLGKLVESSTEDEVRASWEKETAFIRGYLESEA